MSFGLISLRIRILTAHDCKYRKSLARQKKSKTLIICHKNPFGGTIFENNFFKFQESIVFEKMRKNQNSGIYLINYAKIRVKMTLYFIASVPVGKIQTYKTEIFFVKKRSIFSFYPWYVLNHKRDFEVFTFFF